MKRPGRRTVEAALAVVAFACSPLIHFAFVEHWKEGVASVLLAAQASALAFWAIQALPGRRRFLAAVAFLPFTLTLATSARVGLSAGAGLSHMLLFGGLFLFFGRTLLPGHEPLVTGLARRLRGPLPPELARYTRRVTAAWCLFFVGELLASALLFAFASRSVWSGFVTLVDLPLVVLMFAAEYGWRRWHYPGHAHSGPLAVVRAFAAREAAP